VNDAAIRCSPQPQFDWQLEVSAAEHPKILKLPGFWPDREVIWAGKVPIMGYMAYWPDDFVPDIQFARPARGQMFTSDDHHFMPVAMARAMSYQVNSGNRG
jgi:hypothetical protein